jgi:hypothetical protein
MHDISCRRILDMSCKRGADSYVKCYAVGKALVKKSGNNIKYRRAFWDNAGSHSISAADIPEMKRPIYNDAGTAYLLEGRDKYNRIAMKALMGPSSVSCYRNSATSKAGMVSILRWVLLFLRDQRTLFFYTCG